MSMGNGAARVDWLKPKIILGSMIDLTLLDFHDDSTTLYTNLT